jgi:imidazolonepropionase-like amidohydrolase
MRCIKTAGVYHPDEEVVRGSVLVFEDGEVTSVRDEVPDEAEVLFETDGYAMPGLVDAHSHTQIRPWEGDQLEQMRAPAAEGAVRAAANLRRDLLAGTTTMRLMGSERLLDVRLAELEREGELLGPRLLPCGVHLTPTGGHGVALTATNGEAAIRERIRENLAAGAHHVKYFATGGVSSRSGALDRAPYSDDEVEAIVSEAHRQGVHVATHAHGGAGARQAIEAGVDTVEHGAALDPELLDRIEENGQHVVGTFTILHSEAGIETGDGDDPEVMAKVEQAREREQETWTDLVERDVPVALGTDSMHGFLPAEVEHLVERGASAARAVRAVTSEAARAARVADRVGTLEPGKRADCVVVADPPSENPGSLAEPLAVVKDGRVVAEEGALVAEVDAGR